MRYAKSIAAISIFSVLLCGCEAGQTGRTEGTESIAPPNTERINNTEHAGNTEDVKDTENTEGTASRFPYTFTDSTGEEITLTECPQTVAVLFSSYADVWTLAGGQVNITVGESVKRGFADDTALLVDSGAGQTIDHELLISYEPDFVICSSDIKGQSETAAFLTSVQIPCAQFQVDSFEDYLSMLKICTDITGNPQAYETYGTDIQKTIDSVLDRAKEVQEEKKILFIRSGSGSSSAKAKTADQHFVAQMLEELGVYNIADNAPVLLDGLSLEEILKEDPAFIFISPMGNEEAAKAYMDSVIAQPSWQSLTAVRESNYFYLPKDLFQFKPNAKWGEAYQYLAKLLYPEIDFDE